MMQIALLDILLPGVAGSGADAAAGAAGAESAEAGDKAGGQGFFAALLSGGAFSGMFSGAGAAQKLPQLLKQAMESADGAQPGLFPVAQELPQELRAELQALQAEISRMLQQAKELENISEENVVVAEEGAQQALAQVNTRLADMLAAAVISDQHDKPGKVGIYGAIQRFLVASLEVDASVPGNQQPSGGEESYARFQQIMQQLRAAYALVSKALGQAPGDAAAMRVQFSASVQEIRQEVLSVQYQGEMQVAEAPGTSDNSHSPQGAAAAGTQELTLDVLPVDNATGKETGVNPGGQALQGVPQNKLVDTEANAGGGELKPADVTVAETVAAADEKSVSAGRGAAASAGQEESIAASAATPRQDLREPGRKQLSASEALRGVSDDADVAGGRSEKFDMQPKEQFARRDTLLNAQPGIGNAAADAGAAVRNVASPEASKNATKEAAGGSPLNAAASTALSSTGMGVMSGAGAEQVLPPRHEMPFMRMIVQQQAADSGSPNASQQPPVADQVLVQIRQGMKFGGGEVRVQLEPAELGKVDVRMDVQADGRTGVVVTAESRDALDALQREVRYLERALNDLGFKTDGGSMQFNLRGGQQHAAGEQGGQQRQGNGSGQHGDGATGKKEDETQTIRRMRVSLADGLDITI